MTSNEETMTMQARRFRWCTSCQAYTSTYYEAPPRCHLSLRVEAAGAHLHAPLRAAGIAGELLLAVADGGRRGALAHAAGDAVGRAAQRHILHGLGVRQHGGGGAVASEPLVARVAVAAAVVAVSRAVAVIGARRQRALSPAPAGRTRTREELGCGRRQAAAVRAALPRLAASPRAVGPAPRRRAEAGAVGRALASSRALGALPRA
eukprot:scaffold2197_cov62-Phaeocystis_antarctica.AAC.3